MDQIQCQSVTVNENLWCIYIDYSYPTSNSARQCFLSHLPSRLPSRSLPSLRSITCLDLLPLDPCLCADQSHHTSSVTRVLASLKIFFITTATIILTVTRLKNGWWLAWKWSRARQHYSWCSHWWASGSIRLQASSICSCTPFITWSSIFPFSVSVPNPTADRKFLM